MGGHRQLLFVCCTQVPGIPGRQAVYTMLAEEERQGDRYRFVEVEPHRAGLG